jgi:hypothetical protein
MLSAYLLDLIDRLYRTYQYAGLNGGQDNSIALPAPLLRELGETLRSTRYGTIESVIHDGRVVQLERRGKVRFFEHLAADQQRG